VDPTQHFLPQYACFWKADFESDVVREAKEKLKALKQYVSFIIKEVLRSQAHFKSEFIQELLHFYKSDEKELCSD